MTDKPEYVDLIKAATHQKRLKPSARAAVPSPPERPRMSKWPPPRLAQWRLELRKPWKAED